MSPRQKKFCELYAACGNATEAARRAGYSEKTAKQQGARLLTNVDLQDYIHELQEDDARHRIASAAQIKAFWSDVMRDTSQKTADRLKASEFLGKTAGMFVEKIEVGTDEGQNDVIIYLPEVEKIEDEEDISDTEEDSGNEAK